MTETDDAKRLESIWQPAKVVDGHPWWCQVHTDDLLWLEGCWKRQQAELAEARAARDAARDDCDRWRSQLESALAAAQARATTLETSLSHWQLRAQDEFVRAEAITKERDAAQAREAGMGSWLDQMEATLQEQSKPGAFPGNTSEERYWRRLFIREARAALLPDAGEQVPEGVEQDHPVHLPPRTYQAVVISRRKAPDLIIDDDTPDAGERILGPRVQSRGQGPMTQ
jgi:hypothetical protein